MNMIVQYFTDYDSLGEFPRICCYPIDITVQNEMLLQSIDSILAERVDIDIPTEFSFVYLLGEYRAATKSVHVRISLSCYYC